MLSSANERNGNSLIFARNNIARVYLPLELELELELDSELDSIRFDWIKRIIMIMMMLARASINPITNPNRAM